MQVAINGRGNPNAKIVIVGEAPGAEEELKRLPFVGASGKELERMISEAGVPVSDCWFTNVVRYRPPGNDIEKFVSRKETPETPVSFKGRYVAPFVPDHVERLEEEITNIGPSVIIACGNTPLWALAGLESISKWRGSMLRIEVRGKEFDFLPIYHPAAILREWRRRSETVADIRKVHRVPFLEPQYSFIINPSFDEVLFYLDNLSHRRDVQFLAVDIETSRKAIECLGIAWSPVEAMCIPISKFSIDQEMEIIKSFRSLAHKKKIIGQNFLYDAFMLYLWWGIWLEPYFDTMIGQNVLFPDLEKSLDYLASIYCQFYRYWKDDVKDWSRQPDQTTLWRYNCQDCVVTFEVFLEMSRSIRESGLWPQLETQMSLFSSTLRAMFRGVRLDPSLRESFAQRLDEMLGDRISRLEFLFGGEKVEPHNPHSLKRIFYEGFDQSILRVPIISHRKTGRPTLNDEALDSIAKKEPLLERPIEIIRECRTISVLRNTFISLEGPRDRFFCSLNPAGTKTYRFSSGKNILGWGTNGQNIPKREDDEDEFSRSLPDIRSMFIADPEMILFSLDLQKADLHVVVWESDEEELRVMLAEGRNVYKENASVVGLPYKSAKSFIHATNYGGKARSICRQPSIRMPERDAVAAQEAYLSKYPGIRRWHHRVEKSLRETSSVSNRFGYRIHFFDRPESVLPEALAWIPQSTVACVINRIWLNIESLRDPDIQVLLPVHDELMGQIKESRAEELIEKIRSCASVVVPYERPLVIPFELKLGRSWGQMTTLGK